ncbi:MAG: response regulator transcription factor [Roseivivax sp.]|nr:response regulator transcription factor [Roseivivax sp.]
MKKEILIADDHAFTAAGMQAALAALPGVSVLPPVGNGLDAIALAKRLRPALAILDYAMPDANGLEVFVDIRRWSPGTACVIVTASTVPAVLRQIAEAGIDGLFPKAIEPAGFAAAIAQVLAGVRVIHPDMARRIAEADEVAQLTAREIEVLHALARGQTTAAVAKGLGISPKTVETHRASLMRKLDVGSTPSLLVRAMRLGLVD